MQLDYKVNSQFSVTLRIQQDSLHVLYWHLAESNPKLKPIVNLKRQRSFYTVFTVDTCKIPFMVFFSNTVHIILYNKIFHSEFIHCRPLIFRSFKLCYIDIVRRLWVVFNVFNFILNNNKWFLNIALQWMTCVLAPTQNDWL